MKTKKKHLFLSVLIIMFCFCCDEFETDADKGKKAAGEFCDCLNEGYSVSKCNEKFHDKYGKNFSEGFITAFDKEGKKCNIKVEKK